MFRECRYGYIHFRFLISIYFNFAVIKNSRKIYSRKIKKLYSPAEYNEAN